MLSVNETFLQLVRLGIGVSNDAGIHKSSNWDAIKTLAEEQGLSAVVLDALNTHSTNLTDTMPVQMKLEWISEVLQNYEARYVEYEKAIGSLAGWYNQHGFKMMVLKGYACAMNWPKPEHRPCGDIDIWLFGQQRKADKCLKESTKHIEIDTSHHHTVFDWMGFMVENHYDFINVHHHKSNAAFEAILKELGIDDSHYLMLDDASIGSSTRVYLPSPNLHALFLIKHACMEFAASGLNLRQLIDWAFFVKAHGNEVDWDWLLKVLEQFGMKAMFDTINAICVDNLGFSINIFPYVQFDPTLKERVLNEILSSTEHQEKPVLTIPRLVWKYRRWKANEWKHKLCYKESMWSAFWSGVWGHLLKPNSI